jgi:hypothetical protein
MKHENETITPLARAFSSMIYVFRAPHHSLDTHSTQSSKISEKVSRRLHEEDDTRGARDRRGGATHFL